jgi:hypothetical protein
MLRTYFTSCALKESMAIASPRADNLIDAMANDYAPLMHRSSDNFRFRRILAVLARFMNGEVEWRHDGWPLGRPSYGGA